MIRDQETLGMQSLDWIADKAELLSSRSGRGPKDELSLEEEFFWGQYLRGIVELQNTVDGLDTDRSRLPDGRLPADYEHTNTLIKLLYRSYGLTSRLNMPLPDHVRVPTHVEESNRWAEGDIKALLSSIRARQDDRAISMREI